MKAPGDSEQQEGEGSCARVTWPKETLYWLMKDIQSSTKLAETGDSVLGSNEEERFWGITSSKSSVQITEVRHRSPPAAVVLAGLH